MEDFRLLKDEVEKLIRHSQLWEYVWGVNRPPQQQAHLPQRDNIDGRDIEVRIIIGKLVISDTNITRKNYARKAR